MKKLMHILLTSGLMLCLVEPVISQDSVADVFPLAIGNQWRYEYTTFKLEPPADIIYTDSGWVQYMVTDRTIFADSTLWTLMQTRHFRHCQRSGLPPPFGSDTCYTISDTNSRHMIEFHRGGHQLVLVGVDWRDVYPFAAALSETTTVLRYRQVDASGRAVIRTSERDAFCAHSFLMTFQQGIGMVAIQCSLLRCTNIHSTNHTLLSHTIVSVNELSPPTVARLHQNYPNPFNPKTTIRFSVGTYGHTSLRVFDVLGHEVATLVDEMKEAGEHAVVWDASAMASGIYFYRIISSAFSSTRCMLLLK